MSAIVLAFSGVQHLDLKRHLFPGDGREAAAIVLCKDAGFARNRLLAHTIFLVPHDECQRASDRLTWPGEWLSRAIDVAEAESLSIILTHSHPGGLFEFSAIDDESDRMVVPTIFAGWSGQQPPLGHGSAIMTPCGGMRARLYDEKRRSTEVSQVAIIGDDIRFVFPDEQSGSNMAFGASQTALLSRLHAVIIGASGTGSVIAEQVVRLGFSQVTLIDFDRVESKNLNRILNSTQADANAGALKVEVIAKALRAIRPDVTIHPVPESIASRAGVLAAVEGDIIFSCVDSAEGRQIADLIVQAFVIPLIDMGVTIPTRRIANGGAAVADVLERIDYVQPGGATLFDRGVFSASSLRAEYLLKAAPEEFAQERDAGYIRGAPEEAPSVISLNMHAASAAMLEFLARVLPYRHEPNRKFARTLFSAAEPSVEHFSEDEFDATPARPPRGKKEPLLGIPSLGAPQS